ncbi:MAG: ABC transporter permease [Chthoniobacterales bacterium]
MITDFKYALRTLLKTPAFSIIAVLTLALGIGSSTAIFSVADAVLLRPLPYPQQERIVELRELDAKARPMAFAEPNFDDFRARNHSFEALARYAMGPDAVVGGSEPVQTEVCSASADFFRVLGVQPALGRLISSAATAENKEIAVVSDGFWKRYLDARPSLDGTTLRLENRTFAVIGVLPPGTEFPPQTAVWIPAKIYPPAPSRTAHNWRVAGRLRAGVSLQQARAEASAIGRQLKVENGNETDAAGFGITPLRERFVRDIRTVLGVVGAAVALLLIIACSNVANLLLVRATARRQEMAVRSAMGASRWRLARQFILETVVVTVVAGALGVVLAFWGVDLMLAIYQGNLPQIGRIGVNSTVLLFTLGVSILVGLVLGLVPAFSASHRQLQNDLQSAGRGKSTGRASIRFRNFLIVSQVALTLMLLIGAGLLGRSFQRLLAVNPGFQTEHAITMMLSTQFSEDPAAQRQPAEFYHELMERLRALPGVNAVGAISFPPMSGFKPNGTFMIEEGAKPATTMEELSKQLTALAGTGKTGDADYRTASAGYFTTLDIPLLRGRLFQESDGPDSPHAALISETMARRFWPNENPIGRQIQFGNMDGDLHLLHVVGVVGDVRDESLEAVPRPIVYTNYFQRRLSPAGFCLVLRGQGDTATLISAMRRETRALNPEVAMKFQTIREIVSASVDNRRFSVVMLSVFAGAALILAMVGLYGIMAYITAQRTTEIGIRMALGAQRGDMLRMILRQSLLLAGAGVAVGILAAIGATRLLASMLYGIGSADLVTYAGVVLLLGLAALLASYIPARRAMNVDPMVALRHE